MKKKKLFRTQLFFGFNRSDVNEYINILEAEVEEQRKIATERELAYLEREKRSENAFELEEYIRILERKLNRQKQEQLKEDQVLNPKEEIKEETQDVFVLGEDS